MIVGYNYAWASNKFGIWLGPRDRQDLWPKDYATRWKDLEFKKQMSDNLKILRDNGVQVVRWFLLGNGYNYGLPPRVLSIKRGDKFEPTTEFFNFDPPNHLDPLFLDHFQQLLEMHHNVKMQMIPSLLDFQFFSTLETKRTTAGGRGQIATDSSKRNQFLFSVLGEFLRVSLPYRDTIYAWEVMNEPFWDISFVPYVVEPLHQPYLPTNDMIAFLGLCINWITDKKFPSTVGHRFYTDLNPPMPTGSLPQFHYYATDYGSVFGDQPPLKSSSATKAVILGELGALIGKGYELNEKPPKGSYGAPWDQDFPDRRDRDPSRTVLERLTLVQSLGYELALVWPDLDDNALPGDALKLSSPKLAQIKTFVTGHPSP